MKLLGGFHLLSNSQFNVSEVGSTGPETNYPFWSELIAPPVSRLIGPLPLVDLGLVGAELISIGLRLDLHVPQLLLSVGSGNLQLRNAVNHVDRQAESVDLVLD